MNAATQETNALPFDPDVLYNLLITLFSSTGMRLSIVSPEGVTLKQNERYTEVCDYVRQEPSAKKLCDECTLCGIQQAMRMKKPYSYRCHMGLVATNIPLFSENRLIAHLMFSGYRMEDEAMAELQAPIPVADLQRDYPQLYAHFQDNVFYPQARIQELIQLISVSANYLVGVSAHAQLLMTIQNKSLELLTTANIQEQKEKKVNQLKLRDIIYQRWWDEFLYDAMDQACILASEEKAPRTAQFLQDLALHTRKGHQAGRLTTLGQELLELRSYIRLLKEMYGDRIQISVQVTPGYDPELELPQIPFATLGDLTLRGPLSEVVQGGKLEFSLTQRPEWVEVVLTDNGAGYPPQMVKRINRLQFEQDDAAGRNLSRLIAQLWSFYGSGFSWRYTSEPGVQNRISLTLPIRKEREP